MSESDNLFNPVAIIAFNQARQRFHPVLLDNNVYGDFKRDDGILHFGMKYYHTREFPNFADALDDLQSFKEQRHGRLCIVSGATFSVPKISFPGTMCVEAWMSRADFNAYEASMPATALKGLKYVSDKGRRVALELV